MGSLWDTVCITGNFQVKTVQMSQRQQPTNQQSVLSSEVSLSVGLSIVLSVCLLFYLSVGLSVYLSSGRIVKKIKKIRGMVLSSGKFYSMITELV